MRKSLILALASALVTTTYADPEIIYYNNTGGSWGYTGVNSNWRTATGTQCDWKDNSIADFGTLVKTLACNLSKTFKPYGIVAEVKAANVKLQSSGGLEIGGGGIHVTPNANNRISFWFSGALTLSEDQTWRGEATTSYKTGGWALVGLDSSQTATGEIYIPSSFTMASGKTLTIDTIAVDVTAQGNFDNANIYVLPTASLKLNGDVESFVNSSHTHYNRAMLNAKTITIDGGTFTLANNRKIATDDQFNVAQTVFLKDGGKVVGANGLFDTPTVEVAGADNSISGTFAIAPSFALQGNGSLEIALKTRDDNITVTSLASYLGSGITVSGGTLEISHDAVWPDEFSVTLGDNGFLKFQTTADHDEHVNSIKGKKENVVVVESEWKVTDVPVDEAELSVDTGKELHIYGNGLTAKTTLILNGGTVTFEQNATIASPISNIVTSIIRTKDDTIVGTLSGFITADDDPSLSTDPARNLLTLSGPGKIVLSGGGLFDHYAGLELSGGYADVTNATFRFGKNNGATVTNNRGGPVLVTDNAEWLTIKDGGEIILTQGNNTVAHNSPLKIDVALGREGGIILEDRGTLTIENQRYTYIGFSQRTTANNYLKINGGTLNLPKNGGSFEVAHSTSKGFLVFNSGTFLANKSIKSNNIDNGKVIWNGGTWKFSSNADDGIQRLFYTSDLPLEINGPDCILDISDVYNNRTISCCDKDTNARWTFGENGVLTVLGSQTNPTKFKINSVFTDSNIVLSNITAITTNTVTGPTFASIGFKEGAKFDASLWTSSAEIGTLVIKEGGEWNGGANLVNATFENLTFEDGAILNVSTADTCNIAGTLTLPEQMQYMITGSSLPSRLTVFSAVGGIVQVDPAKPRKTEWALVAGMRAHGFCTPEVLDDTLVMDRFGSILILR